MSFFADFVGGAAKTLLDERKVALAEKLRQEEEERRRNFQLDLEQRTAERQFDRDNKAAESQQLERDERREERQAERAYREKKDKEQFDYQNKSLALRAREADESRASRDDYRRSQDEEKERISAERAAQAFMSGLMVEDASGKVSPRPGIDPVSVRNAMSYYEELIAQGKYREAMKALRGAQQSMVLGDPLPANAAVSERY
jgi:hypothetical protein